MPRPRDRLKALYTVEPTRRKGVLASKVPSAPTTDGDFITVRMAETPHRSPTDGHGLPDLHAGGHVIECTEWPAASWISALLAGRRMLRPDRSIEVVYLHRAPVDFRKQMDGLAAIIERAVHMNPFSGRCTLHNKRKDNSRS